MKEAARYFKGTLLGTPKREPQEYSRNIMEYKDPGRYIPIIYLYLLYSFILDLAASGPRVLPRKSHSP